MIITIFITGHYEVTFSFLIVCIGHMCHFYHRLAYFQHTALPLKVWYWDRWEKDNREFILLASSHFFDITIASQWLFTISHFHNTALAASRQPAVFQSITLINIFIHISLLSLIDADIFMMLIFASFHGHEPATAASCARPYFAIDGFRQPAFHYFIDLITRHYFHLLKPSIGFITLMWLASFLSQDASFSDDCWLTHERGAVCADIGHYIFISHEAIAFHYWGCYEPLRITDNMFSATGWLRLHD